MNEEEIVDFLFEWVGERGEVLGAHLGAILGKQFPRLRSDPDYPGLKQFIKIYAQGRLEQVEETDAYRVVGTNASQTKSPVPQPSPISMTAWDIFQNPAKAGEIFVDPITGDLKTGLRGKNPPDGILIIPKISTDEHREIATDYINRVEAKDHERFMNALNHPDYWSHWTKLVNQPNYKKDWFQFRYSRVTRIFKDRLDAAGLSDEVADVALKNLLTEKKIPSRLEKSSQGIPFESRSAFRLRSGSGISLKDLIHEVIDKMGDEELRKIWLPVGSIIDSLRKDSE